MSVCVTQKCIHIYTCARTHVAEDKREKGNHDGTSYQSSRSFLRFLHFAVRPFAESFQKLVPVLQVVLVVVPLDGLPLHGHLNRGFGRRWVRRWSPDARALHTEALALLVGAGERGHSSFHS